MTICIPLHCLTPNCQPESITRMSSLLQRLPMWAKKKRLSTSITMAEEEKRKGRGNQGKEWRGLEDDDETEFGLSKASVPYVGTVDGVIRALAASLNVSFIPSFCFQCC